MRRIQLASCAVCVVLCLFAACSSATLYVDPQIERHTVEAEWVNVSYTLEELSAMATAVVQADVLEVRCDENGYSLATLCVRASVKGDLSGEIVVRDTAWPYEASAERSWCGEPMMRPGHRVILYLTESDTTGVYTPIGNLAAAKFFLDADNTYHNALLYSACYNEQAAQSGDPRIPDLTDMTPKTFEELRAFTE